jgi:hypothetical protein
MLSYLATKLLQVVRPRPLVSVGVGSDRYSVGYLRADLLGLGLRSHPHDQLGRSVKGGAVVLSAAAHLKEPSGGPVCQEFEADPAGD